MRCASKPPISIKATLVLQPNLRTIATRAVGGAGGIALMETLARWADAPLMTVPFATSIVMIMGAPESPPARPHCVIGGHIISAAAGIVCTLFFGHEPWVAAIGVGMAIALMHIFDAFHPPAGINPIIITTTQATPLFIIAPVASGALILTAYAYLYHRASGERWTASQS